MKTTTLLIELDSDGIEHGIKADGFFSKFKLWKDVVCSPEVAIGFAVSGICIPHLINWIMGW